MLTAECVWPLGATLGEGALWSATDQALWFIDITGRHIHRYSEHQRQSWLAPDVIGFIAPASDGSLICGVGRTMQRFNPRTGAFTLITAVPGEPESNRLNDACVDDAGRLWFGSMNLAEQDATGAVYCWAQGRIRRVDDGYVIPNGPAISPDGRTMYVVDSTRQLIRAVHLHRDGEWADVRTFARIEEAEVYPDGVAVDAEGCVWVALYGGWRVQRFSPQGARLEAVDLPVAQCTKCAFGGADYRDLYITTATQRMTATQRAEQPLAGGLFRVRAGVSGLPSPLVPL